MDFVAVYLHNVPLFKLFSFDSFYAENILFGNHSLNVNNQSQENTFMPCSYHVHGMLIPISLK